MNWSEIAPAAATLFLVMDPLGNMPVFNAVLAKLDPRRRSAVAPSKPPSSSRPHCDSVGTGAGSRGVTLTAAEAGPVPALLVAVTLHV